MGCITNTAYMAAASQQTSAIVANAVADTAIQLALALWQRKAKRSINEMQVEIADRQMKLAEAVQAHAEQFWPHEDALVADTFMEPTATENYDAAAMAWNGLAVVAISTGRSSWVREARRLCAGPTRCEDARFQRLGMMVRSDMQSFALRTEEARVQEYNDRRYERQVKVLSLSRGRLSTVEGFTAAHSRAGTTAAAMLDTSINQALSLFGYSRTQSAFGQWGYGSAIRETWGTQPFVPQVQGGE